MIAYAQGKAKNKTKLNKYMQYINGVFSYKFGKSLQVIEAAPPAHTMT